MDVATSVTKYAPNFCSVYVIAKGKLSTFRPATQAIENDTSKEDTKSDAPDNQLLAAESLCFSDSLVGYSLFTHEALVGYSLFTHEALVGYSLFTHEAHV
jgi:hypothetical protein